MKTNVQQIAERIEHILASEQWAAMKKSFASRMDVTNTTSLSIKERLETGELSFLLNYELGDKGLYLSTYTVKVLPYANDLDVKDKDKSPVEVVFNAKGKYVFNFREAINLLEGRAVLKSYVSMDGVAKQGWFKADKDTVSKDFQFYFSGGQSILPKYNLEGVVKKLPMTDLSVGQKTELIRSLQSGDLQEVKLYQKEKEVNSYIQASPEAKGVSIFDEKMRPLRINELIMGEEKIKQHKRRGKGLSVSW